MTVSELFRGFSTHFVFFFSIFLHASCKSEFCSLSEWRVRYLKGQTWSTLKAATDIIDHGAKTRISVEQQAKVLVYEKKTRRSSSLEIARKCQISKSTVAWMCHACMHWACITYNNFTQRVPIQIFESCFQPLGVISLYLFTKWYYVTFF